MRQHIRLHPHTLALWSQLPRTAGLCAQVALLHERRGSLEHLALCACDLMDHDPDMPLIFDLTPLTQVTWIANACVPGLLQARQPACVQSTH